MNVQESQALTIGVDLGATSVRIAAWSPAAQGEILESAAIPTRITAGPEAVVDDICGVIRGLIHTHGGGAEPLGVGIGSPGPLELPAGRLHQPPNLPGWDGFELRAEMERRLHLPVIIDGDANTAALGEYAFGLGRLLAVDSLCMLTLGTGVGGGIILNGRIWHGAAGMAGEAGHLTVDPAGPRCGCGNTGCIEAYASATALTQAARRGCASGDGASEPATEADSRSASDLAEDARQGDTHARRIFDDAGRALGIGLATLINMLNLPLYVIGGGVAGSWDLISPALFDELPSRSYVYRLTRPGGPVSHAMPAGGTQVLPAHLGPEAGLLGACILPLPAADSRMELQTGRLSVSR